MTSKSIKEKKDINADLKVALKGIFIAATIDALRGLADSQVKSGTKRVNHNDSEGKNVAGMIKISGQIEGIVAVTFPPDLALELAVRMAGCPAKDLNENDIVDGVSEIINQIAGIARNSLWENGYQFEISLPSPVVEVRSDTGDDSSPVSVIELECFDRPFLLHLQIKLAKETK